MHIPTFTSAVAPVGLTSSNGIPSLSNASAAAIANVVFGGLVTAGALLILLYLIEIIIATRRNGENVISALYIYVLPLTVIFIACTTYRALNLTI